MSSIIIRMAWVIVQRSMWGNTCIKLTNPLLCDKNTRMELDVIDPAAAPWYADGLKFTCTQCGNCCTGGPGFVWISKIEIVRLAEFLKITPEDVVEKYCRKVAGKFSLIENRNPATGLYDCIFLKEIPAKGDGSVVVHTRRVCPVYSVRPLQCRTWPFWEMNLSSQKVWDHSSRRCPGINRGKSYTRRQMEELRDATDWPAAPPTSEGEK